MLPGVQMFTHLVDIADNFYHKHVYYEIFYVISGEIEHVCNGVSQNLKRGDMFILRPHDEHTFVRPAKCTHRDIVISPELFHSVCDFIDDKLLNKISAAPDAPRLFLEQEQVMHLENLLSKLSFMLVNSLDTKESFARTCIATLLGYFLEKQAKINDKSMPLWFENFLERFTNLTFLKGGIPLMLSDIPYNHIYICRVFKKYMGITMMEHLNEIRLNYAALYLKTREASIENIANELGFSSPNYFYKIFRQKYNCTPNEYRNKL